MSIRPAIERVHRARVHLMYTGADRRAAAMRRRLRAENERLEEEISQLRARKVAEAERMASLIQAREREGAAAVASVQAKLVAAEDRAKLEIERHAIEVWIR